MCVKGVNTSPLVFDSIPDRCKSQKIGDKVIFKDPVILLSCYVLIDIKPKKCIIKLLMLFREH